MRAIEFKNKYSGYCINVPRGKMDVGLRINQWTPHIFDNQTWLTVLDPNHQGWRIVNVQTKKFLDVFPDGVVQNTYDEDSKSQLWQIVLNKGNEPYYKILNVKHNKVLQASDVRGSNIQLVNDSDQRSQWWDMNIVDKPDINPAAIIAESLGETPTFLHAKIKKIGCIWPSAGTDNTVFSTSTEGVDKEFRKLFSQITEAASGTPSSISDYPSLNGQPLYTKYNINASFEDMVSKAAQTLKDSNQAGSRDDDDVYIRLEGEKFWPRDDSHHPMNTGDVDEVNVEFVFGGITPNFITISIMDHDKALWFIPHDPDHLGEVTLTGDKSKSGVYVLYSEKEKSIYLIDVEITGVFAT